MVGEAKKAVLGRGGWCVPGVQTRASTFVHICSFAPTWLPAAPEGDLARWEGVEGNAQSAVLGSERSPKAALLAMKRIRNRVGTQLLSTLDPKSGPELTSEPFPKHPLTLADGKFSLGSVAVGAALSSENDDKSI